MAISTKGCRALPMLVQVAKWEDLATFFEHSSLGGNHTKGVKREAPYYGTKAAEFRKGVVHADGRMVLRKMAVGGL